MAEVGEIIMTISLNEAGKALLGEYAGRVDDFWKIIKANPERYIEVKPQERPGENAT